MLNRKKIVRKSPPSLSDYALEGKPSRLSASLAFLKKHRASFVIGAYSAAAFLTVLLSDTAYASKIEDQLDAMHKLTTGSVVKAGMGVATIGGAIVAVMKQSPGLAAVVAGIGIAFSYYMGWLNKYDWTQ